MQIDETDEQGFSLLHVAAEASFDEGVRIMLVLGATAMFAAPMARRRYTLPQLMEIQRLFKH